MPGLVPGIHACCALSYPKTRLALDTVQNREVLSSSTRAAR
jgi:hypothetical protein